jgi:hypothetical protein
MLDSRYFESGVKKCLEITAFSIGKVYFWDLLSKEPLGL